MRNRKPLLLLALLMTTGAAGLAVAADTPATPTKPARATLDTNGDGFVDKAEMEAMRKARAAAPPPAAPADGADQSESN